MKRYKWIYLGLVLYTTLLLYSYLHNMFAFGIFHQTTYSIADLLINTFRSNFYIKIFILPFLIGILINMKKYKTYNQILQYNKRIKMIQSQVLFLIAWSAILTLVMIVGTIVVGVEKHKVFINWGSYASYIAIKTGQILPHVSFLEVAIFGFLLLVVKSVMLGLIVTSSWWFFDKVLYGILVVLSITVISWLTTNIILEKPWLFLYGDYTFFTEPLNIIKTVLWAIIFIGILLFLQMKNLNKKNF